ncbi:MAG: CIA30 family protein [Chlamydiae bacterium]|nr:CIA30 family protein [Chlamydiota bacterium]MBI3278120.1 CIA30 family protein [Chlamydiota bacterium]
MNRVNRVLFLLCGMLFGMVSFGFTDELVIQNFDSDVRTDQVCRNFGAWNKDPDDESQGCVESLDAQARVGDQGMSLRLDYDVDSPNPAYNGFWLQMRDLDFSKYKYLNFDVKGDKDKGFSKVVKFELKNGQQVGRYLYTEMTDEWKHAKIPFSSFKGLKDWTKMTEFVIVFDDLNSKPKVGTMNVDNIVVTTD